MFCKEILYSQPSPWLRLANLITGVSQQFRKAMSNGTLEINKVSLDRAVDQMVEMLGKITTGPPAINTSSAFSPPTRPADIDGAPAARCVTKVRWRRGQRFAREE